jgi:hypothetical protein
MAFRHRRAPVLIACGLCPYSTEPESSSTLVSIEPGRTAVLIARVYDQNNQLVPNVDVRLEVDAIENSGSHHHHVSRPKGSLGGPTLTPHIITGNTGTDGFRFTFSAPIVAGDHEIMASCADGKTCVQEGARQVWVGVKGLVEIPASISLAPWNLIGQHRHSPEESLP